MIDWNASNVVYIKLVAAAVHQYAAMYSRHARMMHLIYCISRQSDYVGLYWTDTSLLWIVYKAVNDRPASLAVTLRPPSTDTQSTLWTDCRTPLLLFIVANTTRSAIYNNSNTITVDQYFTT